MSPIIHNRIALKQRRKNLRNNGTVAEAFLWNLIKNKKIGRKFRRQHSVGHYILDFYCPEERLAIELDGPYHQSDLVQESDGVRTAYLEGLGIKVIRFDNKKAFQKPEQVIMEIQKHFKPLQ